LSVVFSTADISLKPLAVDQPTTFELQCVRAVAGQFTAIVAAVYRPGSATVQQLFFDELGAVFEQLATYQAPVYIAGDFNSRLDRPDDPHSAQFHLLADCNGLTLHHTDATHQLGVTLDAVITREDAGRPDNILVVDVQWSVDTMRRETPVVADCCRSWRQLDIDQFRSLLSSSTLCQPDT